MSQKAVVFGFMSIQKASFQLKFIFCIQSTEKLGMSLLWKVIIYPLCEQKGSKNGKIRQGRGLMKRQHYLQVVPYVLSTCNFLLQKIIIIRDSHRICMVHLGHKNPSSIVWILVRKKQENELGISSKPAYFLCEVYKIQCTRQKHLFSTSIALPQMRVAHTNQPNTIHVSSWFSV